MGIYVNPDNSAFANVANDESYVDKSGLIDCMNNRIGRMRPLICFTRPRRFGKSMAANMLAAYYSKGCDSRELFDKLKISKLPSYEREFNKSVVIHFDAQEFWTMARDAANPKIYVQLIQQYIINELKEEYPDCVSDSDTFLPVVMSEIYNATKEKFIVIIDEWDCLFREAKDDTELQDQYINFLRGMFKNKSSEAFIKLAYITGILPIKKYGTQSALNNFREFTMVKPGNLAEYVGFTEQEVKMLCERYHLNFDECKRWYDGYSFKNYPSVYSPNSVMEAIDSGEFDSYWAETETYESLRFYIDIGFDDVRTKIIYMLSGGTVKIDPKTFQNDLKTIKTSDDVLTLLVHLGYLAYNSESCSVYIPNEEVRREFIRATKNSSRKELAKVVRESDALIDATLRMDCDVVAQKINDAHNYYTTNLFYNNEQSLRMVIFLAYITRVDDYCDFQELPSGKGYADVLFFPRKGSPKPALLIELKWNQTSDGAIAQIKDKGYCDAIKNYGGDILLVGVNYDEKTKEHSCQIERITYK